MFRNADIKIKITACVALVLILCALSFGAGRVFAASSGEAGSVTDPLITQSYLELRLNNLENSSGFSTVSAEKGKNVLLSSGDRFVLYSGSAVAKGSLIDLTEGSMLKSGGDIAKFHEYLVTRDENGISMTSAGLVFCSE